jgi:hypothetical protein
MELQSTVDFQAPYRLLLYQVEIWRDMISNILKTNLRRKSFRLPAIVPIVLYSGSRRWTASRNFREYTNNQGLLGKIIRSGLKNIR